MKSSLGLALAIFCLTFSALLISLVALVTGLLFWTGSLAMVFLSMRKKTISYSSMLRLLSVRRRRHGLLKARKKSN